MGRGEGVPEREEVALPKFSDYFSDSMVLQGVVDSGTGKRRNKNDSVFYRVD